MNPFKTGIPPKSTTLPSTPSRPLLTVFSQASRLQRGQPGQFQAPTGISWRTSRRRPKAPSSSSSFVHLAKLRRKGSPYPQSTR
jgi:hypothetical protein